MGQKVHPIGFRLGVKVGDRRSKTGRATGSPTGTNTPSLLHEDLKVRQHIMTRMADAGVSQRRDRALGQQITVTIHAAKPGIVIGKSGVKVEELRRTLEGDDRQADPRHHPGDPPARDRRLSWSPAASPISSKSASRSAAR